MKKLLIIFCFLTSVAEAQDTITIHHKRYTTTYDTVLHYPVLVHWIVKSSDVCGTQNPRRVNRKGVRFKPDPQLRSETNLQKYYTRNNGKYQRGHNMDAADNSCDSIGMKECFYFSNMTPQTAELNEQTWGDLEDETRRLAIQYGKVEVWCGSYGSEDTIGKVTVPKYCWKVIKYNRHTISYIFPNRHDVNLYPYKHYNTRIDSVRFNTHLELNTN